MPFHILSNPNKHHRHIATNRCMCEHINAVVMARQPQNRPTNRNSFTFSRTHISINSNMRNFFDDNQQNQRKKTTNSLEKMIKSYAYNRYQVWFVCVYDGVTFWYLKMPMHKSINTFSISECHLSHYMDWTGWIYLGLIIDTPFSTYTAWVEIIIAD